MRKLLWALAVLAGVVFAVADRRRRQEAEAVATTWAAHTDSVE